MMKITFQYSVIPKYPLSNPRAQKPQTCQLFLTCLNVLSCGGISVEWKLDAIRHKFGNQQGQPRTWSDPTINVSVSFADGWDGFALSRDGEPASRSYGSQAYTAPFN